MCAGMALTTRRSFGSGGVTEPFLGAKLPPAVGLGKLSLLVLVQASVETLFPVTPPSTHEPGTTSGFEARRDVGRLV